MCGIVGFFNREKRFDLLEDMLEALSHRGPDDRGMYFDERCKIHLGHNRLSIQDLSKLGQQPMRSKCGNYVIVFNGEVYNFKTIRKELEKLGYKFKSNTDTEVILNSFIEWEIEKSLKKFIGMFAIAFLDKKKNKLFLIRDRAGIKPLYYYVNDGEFLFASEIKSFHKYPNFKKDLNKEILPYFFQFGYIPAPYTIFKNTYKLKAGHYLEFNIQNSTFKITKYWDVADFYRQEKFKKDENEILYEIEEILSDSVNLRMIADVPVGVFLSGGVDSSFVSALLAKKMNKKIDTFTIGFENKKYDEAKYAAEIAKYLNTNHHEYYVDAKDMLGLVEKLPFFYDEPFGDSSALPTMLVSKKAKEKVAVALSADGGDEAFVGYSKYFFLIKFASVFSNNFKKSLLKTFLNVTNEDFIEKMNMLLPEGKRQRNIKDKYLKFKRAVNSKDFQEMFLNASSYVSPRIVKEILKFYNNEMFNNFYECKDLDLLNYMLCTDYKNFMKDDVLVKVDRASMSVSLESREPLIDHRIIEYMARVPNEIKYKNNQGKYVLRKILYKYVPKELIERPKSGFQIPLNEWLRGELKGLVEYHINEKRLDNEIFDIDEVLKYKKLFFEGKEIGSFIWFILMYQMWKEEWM